MSQSLLLSSNLLAASPDSLAQGMSAPAKGDPQSADPGSVGAFSRVLLDQITDLNKTSQPVEKIVVSRFSPTAAQIPVAPGSAPGPDSASLALAGIGTELDALEVSVPSPFPSGTGLVEGEIPSGKPLPAARQGFSAGDAEADENEGQGPLTLVTWAFPGAPSLPVITAGDRGPDTAEPAVVPWSARLADSAAGGSGSEPPPFVPAGTAAGTFFPGADNAELPGAGSRVAEIPVPGREPRGLSPDPDAIPLNQPGFRDSGLYGARAGDISPVAFPGNEAASRGAGADTTTVSTFTYPGAPASASGPDSPQAGDGAEIRVSGRGAVDTQEPFRPASAGAGNASLVPNGRALSDTTPSAARVPTGPDPAGGPKESLGYGVAARQGVPLGYTPPETPSPVAGVPAAGRERDAMDADRIGARDTAGAGVGASAVAGLQAVPAGRVAPSSITAPQAVPAMHSAPDASGSASSLPAVPGGEPSVSLPSEAAGRALGLSPSSAATGRPEATVVLPGAEAGPSGTYAPGTAATSSVDASAAAFIPKTAGVIYGRQMQQPETLARAEPTPPLSASPVLPPGATREVTDPQDVLPRSVQDGSIAPAPLQSVIARDIGGHKVSAPRPFTPDLPPPTAPAVAASVSGPFTPPAVVDTAWLPVGDDGTLKSSDETLSPLSGLTARGASQDIGGHKVSAPRPFTPDLPPPTAPAVAASVSGPFTPPAVVDTAGLPVGNDGALKSSDETLSPLSGLTARGASAEHGLPSPASFASPAVRAADAPAQTPALPQAPGSLPILLGAATGRLGEELGHRILWLSGHNLRSAEIQLDPPELGPLQIQVQSHRDGASIHFTAHTAAARDAVESNLPRLRELLEGSGLNLLDVNVAQQQQRGARSDRDALESGNPNSRNRLAGIGQVGEVPAPARRSLGLVDDYA